MITDDLLASYQQYTIKASAEQNGYKIKRYYPFLILPFSLIMTFIIPITVLIKTLPPADISAISIVSSMLLTLFFSLVMIFTAKKIHIFNFKYLTKNDKEINFAEDKKKFIQETLLQKGCIAKNKHNEYFFSSIIKLLEVINNNLSKELKKKFVSIIIFYITLSGFLTVILPDKIDFIYTIILISILATIIYGFSYYLTKLRKWKKKQDYYELYLILLDLQLKDSMKKI